MAEKVVVVTGVTGYWGTRFAARLATEAGYHVIGLDREPPTDEVEDFDFIQADVRNPLLVELFRAEGVDTVVHLAFAETIRLSEAAFDLNVMGTTKLLSACQQAGVRKAVLKSSTAVYGARPSNSAFLDENHPLRGSRRYGTIRDLVEIERFCRNFRHQAPELVLTILRFPGIVGPTADTAMTCFLKSGRTPTMLGFDPMMQIIHQDDVVEALLHATLNDAAGAFNVAATDVLPLSKIRGLAGKPSFAILHLFAYWGVGRWRTVDQRLQHYLPMEPDYLRFPWVGDLRRMRKKLGFEPHYTAEETLREFAEQFRGDRLLVGPVSMAHEEERLSGVIEERRQARQQQAATGSEEGGENEESGNEG
jgi:UDP-glucose 4-epimerase